MSQDPILDSPDLAAVPGLRPLVAVLSFTPVDDDEGLRLLGGEISDALRECLARDPALRTILIDSDFLAKAPPHALELACRALRVGHVLSGQCHGRGAQASVYVEVAETRAWNVRWARLYKGNARSLLVQDGETLTQLVTELRPVLMPRRRG